MCLTARKQHLPIQAACVQVTLALMGQGHIGVAVKLSATMIRRGYLLETVRLFGSVAVEACRRVKHGRPGEQLMLTSVVTIRLQH